MRTKRNTLKAEFIRYVIPSIMSQWIYTLYTMVDGMFVAKGVNETALTAVNLSSPFIALLFSLSLMFAVGTSTIVSILLGKGKNDRANGIFTQSIVVQLILAIVIIFIVLINREALAGFLGAKNEQMLHYVVEYISWIAPFSFAFILCYSFEILLKTDGYPKKAMITITIGALENCVLDWLFVIVLHKGLAGAAFATGLSQITVLTIYLHHFLGKKGVLRFCRFRFDPRIVVRQIRNGFSSGVTEMSSGIVTFIFNQMILIHLTQDALVSYTIIGYVNNIVVLSATGIAQGAQPLISYYYGKGSMTDCRKLFRYSIISAGAFCILSFGAFALLAPAIINIYISPELPELRRYSLHAFYIFTTSFFLVGFNIAVSGYFTSVERALEALIISAGRGFLLIVGCLLILTKLAGGPGIWWSPLASEALCLIVTGMLMMRYCRKDRFWNQT